MAGFMAGFGTTLSNSIEEDRKHYREAAAKRRDYIQTYGTRAVLQREDQANQVMGTINALKTAGIEEDDLRYVLDTGGVQGILQLSKTVAERDDLTAEERRKIVKKAKDYTAENPDEDINSLVKRAYGLYKSTDNPVKRERNLFSAMLGLDSRMMEDEVLDDMYVNGMSGRDIYRIMGSAGPKPGEAISLNLPAKPPSPTVLANTTKFLESQFNSSVDSRIKSIRTQMTKANPQSTEYTTLLDEQEQLEGYKSKGLLALGEYATIYDNTLFDFARAQEEALPGSISRNSYLYEFIPAFNTYFGEAADDAAVEGNLNSTPKGEVPTIETGSAEAGTKPEGKGAVVKFKTKEEFNKAAAAGEVSPGAMVSIADAAPLPFYPPKREVAAAEPTVLEGGLTSLLDGKDGNVAEYGALYDALMTLPEDERSDFAREYSRLDTVAPLAETIKAMGEATGDAVDSGLAYAIGGGQYALGAFTAGLGTAYNYLTGDRATATKQRLRGKRTKEEAKKLMAEGIVAHFERKAAEKEPMKRSAILDVPDDSMDAKSERGFGKTAYMSGLMSPSDSVSRTREAPEEEGYKPTNMGATELNNPKVREKLTTAIKKSGVLDKAVDDLIGLAERVADSDRQFANDERNYPQPLPTLMSKPDTAEAPEAEPMKRSEILNVPDDSMDAKSERSMGKVSAMSGLMSPADRVQRKEAEPTVEDEPVRPKARPSRAPRVGQPEFMKLVQSLHGPNSDVVAAWKDKLSASDNKVSWNDVTRLIKQTKELRGSKLRSTLLESLYDYRDALRYKK